MRYPAIFSPSGNGALFCAAMRSYPSQWCSDCLDKSLICKEKPLQPRNKGRILTICSMTGYAVNNRETAAGTITIEIKSVNSRFLDLQFRINDDLRSLEPALRE